jgi:hypothetical protein
MQNRDGQLSSAIAAVAMLLVTWLIIVALIGL